MVKFIYCILFVLLFSILKGKSDSLINIRMGKYKMIMIGLYPCENPKHHQFKFYTYLKKISPNVTEIRGNATFDIPLDDSIQMDLNIATMVLKDVWETVLVLKKSNACSYFKRYLGNSFYKLAKAFNSQIVSCPLPAGVYISSGFDVNELNNNNFPKELIYGKYKLVTKLRNRSNEFLGCNTFIVNITQ